MNQKFFVIEGIDGSGKSTLAEGLFKKITEKYKCIKISEPTNESLWGKEIRNILKSGQKQDKALSLKLRELFKKDRIWDIENRILPALENNKIVLLDRYYFSTAAYQGETNNEVNEIINEYKEDSKIINPHCVLYLNLGIEEALQRVKQRNDKKEIFEYRDSLKRIINNYEYILRTHKFSFPIYVLNAKNNIHDLLTEAAGILKIPL
ncbi:MAG: dTMP kinase [Spirochaetia bacterium]|nr:dTMP kinase [Spirochaetia bacterium]